MKFFDIEMLKLGLASIGGLITNIFGGFDPMLNLLLFIILADILSGIMNGIYSKSLNADKMFKGSIKKVAIFLVIMVAVQIDLAFNRTIPLREIVIIYYIAQEGISFTENISTFTNMPEKFTKYFKNIGKESEEK